MEEKYLPIGTVCTLKGKSRKVMITGYYSVKFNGNLKINDYKGCIYPEGLLISDQTISFNHTDIEKIEFMGYKNEEEKKFMNLFNRLTGNISEEEKAAEFHADNEMFLTSNSTYSKLLFDENGVVMIADLAEPEKTNNDSLEGIKFDENGTVISVDDNSDVENPFHKEYDEPKKKEKETNPSDWKIFNNIEFDENGTVTSVSENTLSEIEFDENGTVISVGKQELEQQDGTGNYKFDENGVVISE